MKVIGLMLCRNSDWAIGLSLRAALLWCDAVVVMMHSCTDATYEIVTGLQRDNFSRIFVMVDYGEEWEEMRLRQTMLLAARDLKATHIALIDDDEVLTGNLLPAIRPMLENLAYESMLSLPWLSISQGVESVITSGGLSVQNASTAFRDMPKYHWASRDGYDFHQRNPLGGTFGDCPVATDRSGGLMHLQFCSMRRLIAKHYLYQLTEMNRWPTRRPASEVRTMYTKTVREAENASLAHVPASWWAPYSHLMEYLHLDAEPWQEAECRRLLIENPKLGDGLEDFGLRENWEI